ncbi:DUF2254 family protein [Thermoactinospora rubra]|uniref:DUF2254 family protein n=1 Tax=Thermoactinospora rubra TaxID=1088767 RepID=UPI000A10FECF|nr:DUF2254 family protein [Thermoactinospora rubra]
MHLRRLADESAPPTLFRRPRRRLRAGLAELGCVLAGLAAGLALPSLPPSPGVLGKDVTGALFTVGFGVLGLASIIFSLLFLVVQFTSSTLTPRLNLFHDDPIVWRTFAFAVGVFTYTITAALAVAHRGRVSLAVPVVALLLTLVAAVLMRNIQVRALGSIRLTPCLDTINERTRTVHDAVYREPYRDGTREPPDLPGPAVPVHWAGRPAVLQQINVPALVAAAAGHDAVIVLRVPLGGQLFQGDLLAEVHGNPVPGRLLLHHVVTGAERSFDQDVTFGLRLLADIALRALSRAVNDPATAVQCLEQIHNLLRRLAGKRLDIGDVADSRGRVRLVVPLPTWDDYLCLALDEVIVAASHTPMVLVRLRDLLRGMHDEAPRARRGSIAARLALVEDRLSIARSV